MLGFGALCLAYGDFVNSLQPVPEAMPGYRLLALLTGVVLSAAGLAILADVGMRPAALVLVVLFALWIVLLHVPGAFVQPALLRSPFWIRVFESAALGGAALILAGRAVEPARESWVRLGRLAFAVALPVFGILHFVYPGNVAALVSVSPVAYPWPLFWAYLTGAGHFAAGIAVLTGVWARPAAILAGLMYASWAVTLHLPRILAEMPARSADNPVGYAGNRPELTSLCVCIGLWGAAWIVAASLPRWNPQAPTAVQSLFQGRRRPVRNDD